MIAGAWVTLGKYPNRNVTEPELLGELEPLGVEPVFELLPHAASTSDSTTVIASVTTSGRRVGVCTKILQVVISTKEVDKIE